MKIKKTFQGELPENRIVNTYSNSLTDAYSANYLNDKLRNVEVSSTEPTNGKDIWVQMGKNLFDKNSSIISGMRYENSGAMTAYETGFCQETYISVQPNTSYVFSTEGGDRYRVCEYDKDKNYLTRFIPDTAVVSCVFTTGPSTEFIRVSGTIDTLDSLQIEQGEFKTDYEPYMPKKIYVKKDEKYELVYDEENTRKEVYVGPYEPKSGEDVWIRKGKNLFNANRLSGFINTKYSNGVVTQILADGHTNMTWKCQAYLNSNYIDNLVDPIRTNDIKRLSFTFTKRSTFNRICFGVNGASIDTTIFVNVFDLIDDKVYTLSFDVVSITQGSISWKNIQIELGDEPTQYEDYVNKSVFTKCDEKGYDLFSNEDAVEYYAVGEQRIGTWIDGKPLYRQVLYSTQRVEAGAAYMPNTSIPNINIVTDVDVTVGAFGYASFKNHWSNDGGDMFISTQFDKNSGLYISADYTGFIGWVLKVEYTKTTD